MRPKAFPESNLTLTAPPDAPEVTDLHVWTDGSTVISKWQLTWRERLQILLYGSLWIRLMTGAMTQPPICLETDKTIFEDPETAARFQQQLECQHDDWQICYVSDQGILNQCGKCGVVVYPNLWLEISTISCQHASWLRLAGLCGEEYADKVECGLCGLVLTEREVMEMGIPSRRGRQQPLEVTFYDLIQ